MEVVARVVAAIPSIDRRPAADGRVPARHGQGRRADLRRDFAYTDEGQLIGHVVMAVGMLDKKLREAERLSGEPMSGGDWCCG